MKKHFFFLAICSMLIQPIIAQKYTGIPKNDPYPGYNHVVKPDPKLAFQPNKLTKTTDTPSSPAYPDHWDNTVQRYFPPAFSQGGYGSCGVSSHVGYMMTSEMNAFHNTDASLPENQLTPMFEYPFTYHGPGKDEMALYVGFPTADIYGGRYESSVYGASEHNRSDWGWVQGYNIFYNAMLHRISYASNFPKPSTTPEGAAAIKAYLYNHNNDPRFGGRGGTACIGVGIAGSAQGSVPASTNNDNNKLTGKKYITHWNIGRGNYDHAMCIVGYDDRIQFDLDNNGIVGETNNILGQNENGAWIIINTWGTGWGNNGSIYCPYALQGGVSQEAYIYTVNGERTLSDPNNQSTNTIKCYKNFGGWTPYVYHYRTGYTPQRTMKVKMEYSKRSEISVKAGIAQNLTAETPEKTFQFSYINYTGDGDNKQGDAETPLLGKWKNGKIHHEPMEFGIDLTDLSASYDQGKPLKYFLIINSKNTANGIGKINKASIIDYVLNTQGVETPFKEKDVTIKTSGQQTIISVIVNGQALDAPTNVSLQNNVLTWSPVVNPLYTEIQYIVYHNDKEIATLSDTNYTLTALNGSYTVKASGKINGVLRYSSVSQPIVPIIYYDNDVLEFNNGGFWLPNTVKEAREQATLEFWFKPNKLINWSDYMGTTTWDGKFMIHTNQDGSITAGWKTEQNNRINSSAGALQVGRWNHLAFVIDGHKLTLYVDGNKVNEITSTQYHGLSAYWDGRFYIGSNNGSLNGTIDEVRLWSVARTAENIKNYYQTPLGNPSSIDGLLTYLKMDTLTKKGQTCIRDWARGYDAIINKDHGTFTHQSTTETRALTPDNAFTSVNVDIQLPAKVVANMPTAFTATRSDNVATYQWSVQNNQNSPVTPAVSSAQYPTFTFTQPGTYTLTLNATDVSTKHHGTSTKTITVEKVEPKADFYLSTDTVKGADRISFLALNEAPGCTYSWSMPGADVTTASTINASARYSQEGQKTVTLTVTDIDGKQYTATKTFVVLPSAPIVDFSVSPGIVIKGDTIFCVDKTTYDPTNWKWILQSANACLQSTEQNAKIIPQKAGIYAATLKATNAVGSHMLTKNRSIVVCNANAQTGLNFYHPNDSLQSFVVDLPQEINTAWTIDFWYKPEGLYSNSTGIYASKDNNKMEIISDVNGNLTLKVNNTTAEVSNYYIFDEWHHYAITFSNGYIAFYRDGSRIGNVHNTNLSDFSNYFKTLTIGSVEAPAHGIFDELRVWNKMLTTSQLREVCQAPISNLQEAKDNLGLQVYYHFNHITGNAIDTCNNIEGKLTGFYDNIGYYSDSKGVFYLNFDDATNETLVGDKLPQSAFQVIKVSDFEPNKNNEGSKVLDGDLKSHWHTKYTGGATEYPHTMTFSRDTLHTIRSLQFFYDHAEKYRCANITIEQSDDSIQWEIVENNHALFSFSIQNMVLEKPVTKKYFRLIFNFGFTDDTMLCINEINFFGDRKVSEQEVLYNIYYKNQKVSYAVDNRQANSQAELPAEAKRDFCTYTYTPNTIPTTGEIRVDVTWSGPFELADNFDDAKWYSLALKPDNSSGTSYPAYSLISQPNITNSANRPSFKRNALWAFAGNPYQIKVWNKEAGNKYIMASQVVNGDGGSTYVSMQNDENATYPHNRWVIKEAKKSSSNQALNIANGFFIFNEKNQALNQRNNTGMSYWTGGYDLGSVFVATEASDLSKAIQTEIKPYVDCGPTYFGLTQEGIDSLMSHGYEKALEKCDAELYEQLSYDVLSYTWYPETGYYRLLSKASANNNQYRYLGTNTQTGIFGNATDNEGTTTIVKLTRATNTRYFIQVQGKYIQRFANNANTPVQLGDAQALYNAEIVKPGIVSFSDITKRRDPNNCLHISSGHNYSIIKWNKNAEASQWIVKKAPSIKIPTQTIDNRSYATLYVPFAVLLPENVTANYLTVSGDQCTTKALHGVIPPATPALVSTPDNTSHLVLPIETDCEETCPTDNCLTGTYCNMPWNSNFYHLGNVNNQVGFYPWNGTELTANQAYMQSETQATGFVLDENIVTNIFQTPSQAKPQQGYDLQGRKVNRITQPGIYIINGKKVVK